MLEPARPGSEDKVVRLYRYMRIELRKTNCFSEVLCHDTYDYRYAGEPQKFFFNKEFEEECLT